MIAFSMSPKIKHLILYMPTALAIQTKDLMLETLPLSLFMLGIIFWIGFIGTIDETEIDGCLYLGSNSVYFEELGQQAYIIECTRIRCWVILEKIAWDRGVFDI